VDPEAYEAYLRGRQMWSPGGERNLSKSLEYFQKAIQKDPGYAPAWAGMADAYNRLASWGVMPRREAAPKAKAAAEKALELDVALVEPAVALAAVKMDYEWDWSGAERLLRQAIEASPNYGHAHQELGILLALTGRNSEGVGQLRVARQADPLDSVFAANLGWQLYLARQYDEAERECRKWREWDPRVRGDYILASIYLATHRPAEAVKELQIGADDTHHQRVLELMYLGHALGVTGALDEGRKVLGEMQALSQSRYVPPDYLAMVYEGLGDRENAIRCYEEAVAERCINVWLVPDQRLDGIRSDPRFQKLMRQMGLPR
jgi:tetratricopeptide (TPR) repeat protein